MNSGWLREYSAIVWRRRWVVALTASVAMFTALAVSVRQRPVYEGIAEFYISDALPPVGRYSGTEIPLLAVLEQVLLPALNEERERSFQGLLTSETVQRRVLEAVPDKPAGEYGRDVQVAPTSTHLMRIRVRDDSPEVAARVANAYPKALEGFLADLAAPHEQQGLDTANRAFERAREGLIEARKDLQEFLESAETPDVSASISEGMQRKTGLERELERSKISLRAAESRIVAAEDRLRRESKLVLSGQRASESKLAHRLMDEIGRIQEEIATKQAQGSEGSANLRGLTGRLEQKKSELTGEMDRMVTQIQRRYARRTDSLEELLRRQIVESYVERTVLEAEISAKTQALRAFNTSIERLPSQRLREEFLRAEVQRYQRMVDSSAISYEEARSQLVGRQSRIVTMREAMPAPDALFPLPRVTGVVGALIGIAAGIYLSFVAEYLTRVRDARVRG